MSTHQAAKWRDNGRLRAVVCHCGEFLRHAVALVRPWVRVWAGLLAVAACGGGMCGCTDSESKRLDARSRPEEPPGSSLTSGAAERLPASPIRFTSRREGSGIEFRHDSGDSAEKPFPAANGSGLAALDYDCDDRCDLYFATGNAFPLESPGAATNRLYRNRGGWKFDDCTEAGRAGHGGYSAGVATGDYDADGFPDVYVACYGRNVLYRNLGDGTFTEVSSASGTADDRWGSSAAFFDYDGDGLLDLFVGNYAHWTLAENPFCGDRSRGLRMFCGPATVRPEPDVLYHNSGDGTFDDASTRSGIAGFQGRAQGVLAADLNQDGWTDLYVTNDLNPNFLFVNQADGTFEEVGELSGTAYDRAGKAQAGMGVAGADVDGNGTFDLLVTNFELEHNAYYENHGQGFFHDVSHVRGLAAASLPWIGWGTAFADFDLDGRPDLVVVNGHVDDNLHEFGREGEYAQPALLWHNTSHGFQLLGGAAGDYFATAHSARALALADLDNDGDWDLICGHQDAPPELLCNDIASQDAPCDALRLRFVGSASNRDAVGAVVAAAVGDAPKTEQVMGGGSYLSASERQIVISTRGAPREGGVLLRVTWPGGRVTTARTTSPRGRFCVMEPRSDSERECRVVRLPGRDRE